MNTVESYFLNTTKVVICKLHLHILSLGRAEASPTVIIHTRKSLYLCMYVGECVCAYCNSVKTVNVDHMLTLISLEPGSPQACAKNKGGGESLEHFEHVLDVVCHSWSTSPKHSRTAQSRVLRTYVYIACHVYLIEL